ncbi:peptidase M24 [Desulfurispirillum indicum S5]|uniref:Peptidase M24 n=1 Tax=Desulfurispirillum indicum (strain ATCC BAA-1389 / DSM 22839 / S5) TaxID=653733 RepID=E6W7E2_DESIS|nr:aminopeptidase P family protein [Desulfurispirillum indicum]ADU66309.1 peptidase M24 [Desulfurispirillum indicum S5]
MTLSTEACLQARKEKLCQRYPLPDSEALLITKRSNLAYFNDFQGTSGSCLLWRQQLIFFTDPRYYSAACGQCYYDEIVCFEGAFDPFLTDFLKSRPIRVLHVEPSLTLEQWQLWKENLSFLEIRPLVKPLAELRMIKDELELEEIRQSCAISINAFEQLRPLLAPGMREEEIAAELEYRSRRLGARKMSFDTIVAAGPSSAVPHHQTGSAVVEQGDALLLDWGARKRYCSDMTRTFFLGEPDEELSRIYRTVLEAQLSAIEQLKPGVKLLDVDNAARSVIKSSGYAEFFGHGTGHSLGIDIHEFPGISPRSAEVTAQPGMVLTIEPGIYLPGKGGVRIEDLIVVHADRLEILTAAMPKDYESALLG